MKISNTPHPVVTLLPRTQAFFKVLHSAVLVLCGELWKPAIARGNGKAKHFFFFPFRFLLCLALLDNQITIASDCYQKL